VVITHPTLPRIARTPFSKLALASVLVLAATGAARALAELSAVSQLWSTGYGRAILVKTALFAVLLGLGWMSRSRVLANGVAGRLRNLVIVELVLALGVVVAVAVLTSLRPGRS
jgi:putative copper export protein